MKNKIIITLFFTLIACAGCEKKLDIVPAFQVSEDKALSTVDGIDGALNYAYQTLHTNLSRTSIFWSEAMADHLNYVGTSQNFENFFSRDLASVANQPVSATDVRLVNGILFRNTYTAINVASLVIRAVEKGYAESDIPYAANKDRILGESYFIRGASEFDLVRFYGKAWGATPENSQPGIIINDGPVDDRESQVKPRATVAQVYAAVISDLKQAEALLPDTYIHGVHAVNYNGRTLKDAATAMLARVYFQQRDYVNAKAMVDKLIGATPGVFTKHPLDVSLTGVYLSYTNANTNSENIFQTTAPAVGGALSGFWNNTTPAFYGALLTVVTDAAATTNFELDAHFYANDLRKTALFRVGSTGRLIPKKYSLTTNFNQPLIRSAEMVLDRAEINAMANNVEDAIKDINSIRARAQIPLLPTGMAQAALLDTIRVERIRELCFEGDRLWNLKRLKLPIPAGERIGTLPLPWDGIELLFKYNSEEIDKNPLLENNY